MLWTGEDMCSRMGDMETTQYLVATKEGFVGRERVRSDLVASLPPCLAAVYPYSVALTLADLFGGWLVLR